ncbi:PIN domain-containing protein [Natronococcus sp.]|uniref:PIN domain-containing protein n=1 Tax=Natronococcus sp. TaxID=35747 RepID=UPI003A4D7819
MNVLETSFLVDYLREQPYTIDYLEANPHVKYAVPTIALYELYAGARRSDATTETIGTVADALEWAERVGFDDESAREAADIRSELLDRGEPIPAPDTLIAGVARSLDAELVATDTHFSEISRLDTVNPRER